MTFADQAHFNNYDATTYGWPQGIPPLVPLTFNGVNFGQCARDAHPVFIALLTELVPHIPGGLEGGKCWGFSTTDDLPDGSWSMHHRGLAIDVDWDVDPMGTYRHNPDAGQLHSIPGSIAHDIATKYGCEYGGDWSGGEGALGFKDYMHFEVHLPPSVARTVQVIHTDPLGADVTNLSPEVHAEIDLIVAKQLARYFPGHDGHQHVLETLVREALADVIATVKADLVSDQATQKKVGA